MIIEEDGCYLREGWYPQWVRSFLEKHSYIFFQILYFLKIVIVGFSEILILAHFFKFPEKENKAINPTFDQSMNDDIFSHWIVNISFSYLYRKT